MLRKAPTRRGGRVAAAAAAALVALLGIVAFALVRDADQPPAADPPLRATPATLSDVFAAAAGGDTIELAAGDYGDFRGGIKRGTVTIRPARGASARMAVKFRRVAGIRLERLTIDGAEIRGRARQVTIARSTFTAPVVIRAHRMVDAGIVLEGNRLPGIDVCVDCYEGRIEVVGHADGPSGVVLRDNQLGPGGNADGIQVSATGVEIVGNRFVGIHQGEGPDAPHTDALQLYGARRTVIRGNDFRDVSTGIMSPDGGDHEVIEDNTFDLGGYPYAIMLGGDKGSRIRHNTMPDVGGCFYEAPCGTVLIGPGPDGAPSRGTVVADNILGTLSVAEGSVGVRAERNLVAAEEIGGDNVRGAPTFVGGARPGARDGLRLADGSPGHGAASDGSDVGAAIAP